MKFIFKFSILVPFILRVLHSGNARAFQARVEGSIPSTRFCDRKGIEESRRVCDKELRRLGATTSFEATKGRPGAQRRAPIPSTR